MKNAHAPRKILMTADTVGGVWTYALELCRALQPHGIQVALATMGAPLSQHQKKQVQQLQNVTVYESAYKLEWMDNPWADVEAAGEWLLKLNAELKPDLVHLNNLVHGHLNWGVPVVEVVHSCVLSWWRAVKCEEAPASWNTYREKVSRSLQSASLVIAPTKAILNEAEKLYGPFRKKQSIHNARDNRKFCAVPKEPYIFAMGRMWDEAKNISLLTSVANQLPWPVYVAGSNQHPSSDQKLELPNVRFLGPLPENEISNWLSKASLYVLPAKYEPFGLSVLEAALSGCALVLGDIATQRELWNTTAAYVNPTEPEALVSTLTELIQNKEHRQELAFAAWQRAQRCSPELMAEQYFRAYRKLLKTGVQATPLPENTPLSVA